MKILIGVLAAALVLLAGCSGKPSTPSAPAKAAHPAVTVKPITPPPAPTSPMTSEDAHAHFLAKYDQDHDGRVSVQEMLKQAVAQQMRSDTNHDGVLSPSEFHRGMGDISEKDPYIRQLFKTIDTNGDGVLDEKELAAHALPGIAALDRNHDGFVDNAGLAAPAAAKGH